MNRRTGLVMLLTLCAISASGCGSVPVKATCEFPSPPRELSRRFPTDSSETLLKVFGSSQKPAQPSETATPSTTTP